MSGFFLAFLLVALCSLGARDAMLVGQLSRGFAKALPLLAPAWLASCASALAAGVGGMWLAPMMPPGGKAMLVAMALGAAAVEMIWRNRRRREPAEPTRSIFAIGLVLLFHQLGDAARFLVFALALSSAEPVLVMAGAALGGGVALSLVWNLRSGDAGLRHVRAIRMGLAAVFVLAGASIAIATLGIV